MAHLAGPPLMVMPYTPVYPENRGQTALEWQSIAASVARRCGLRPQGLCDVHCLGLAVCETTDLAPCCPWPPELP